MSVNQPDLFPSIPLQLLTSMLSPLSAYQPTCYMRQKDYHLRIMIDFEPLQVPKIMKIVNEIYQQSKKQEIFASLIRAIQIAEDINKDVLDHQTFELEKRLLFQKSSVFFDLLQRGPKKYQDEIIEEVFKFIGCNEVGRKIDAQEFALISKMITSRMNTIALPLFDEENSKVFLYYALDNKKQAKKLKNEIENNFYFKINVEVNESTPLTFPSISQKKQEAYAMKINEKLSEKETSAIVEKVENDASLFVLHNLDKTIFKRFSAILDENPFESLYFFEMLIDLQEDEDEVNLRLKKQIKDKKLDIFCHCQELSQPELLIYFGFIPHQKIISLSFLGRKSDLYKFFKKKTPVEYFKTQNFYLLHEKNVEIKKMIKKLKERNEYFKEKDIKELPYLPNSLFIDLSDLNCDRRYICTKNILKDNSSAKGDHSKITESVSENQNDFLSSWGTPIRSHKAPSDVNDINLLDTTSNTITPQGYHSTSAGLAENSKSKEPNNNRGYNSDDKKINGRLFSSEEGEKAPENLLARNKDIKSTYQSLQEKIDSQGSKTSVEEKNIYQTRNIPKRLKLEAHHFQEKETKPDIKLAAKIQNTNLYLCKNPNVN